MKKIGELSTKTNDSIYQVFDASEEVQDFKDIGIVAPEGYTLVRVQSRMMKVGGMKFITALSDDRKKVKIYDQATEKLGRVQNLLYFDDTQTKIWED